MCKATKTKPQILSKIKRRLVGNRDSQFSLHRLANFVRIGQTKIFERILERMQVAERTLGQKIITRPT